MCKYKVEDWVGATEHILKLTLTDYECTFSRGKAGPRPLPGGVHGDGSSNFVGFEIWANSGFFFWGGVSKTGVIF